MLSLSALSFSALTILSVVITTPLAVSPIQSPLNPPLLAYEDVRAELKKAEIIPDVLDDFHPQIYVDVYYPSSHCSVNLGNSVSPSNVSARPVFEIHSIHNAASPNPTPTLPSNVTYTLVLTDPDATSRSDPVKAEMCHWIATDISIREEPTSHPIETVKKMLGAQIDRASHPTDLMPYLPPTPPPKTGFHRYIFVLLASEAETNSTVGQSKLTKPVDRVHWGYGKVGKGVRTWAEENKLNVLGANFFYAKNNEQ